MIAINNGARPKHRSAGSGRGWRAAVCVFLGVVAPLGAQNSLLSGFNPLGNSRSGIQLYDVTGFVGWQSVVNPQGGLFLPMSGTGLKSDTSLGAGASVGWSKRGQKTNLSIMYNAGYQAQIRYTDLSALSQVLAMNASRRLNGKWSLGFSSTAAISTYDQMLFSPTLFSSVAAAPGSFDDLAAAVLTGTYNNDQLASLLTGSPMIESPSRTFFFGDRVFTASASTSLSYAHSKRLSVSFAASADRAQHLTQHLADGEQLSGQQSLYLLPRAVEGSATVSVNYALTPRTQVGANMSASRGFSSIQNAYTTYGSAFIGRTMGRRWYAQVHAGAGFVTYINSLSPGRIGTTPVAGGSLGYKTYAHSFMVSADRTLSQSYGVGAASNFMTSAAWHWWQPGRRWGLTSSYMREQFMGSAFGDVTGWRGGFGMTQRMGEHMVLETDYTYGSYASDGVESPFHRSQQGVRLSVMWMPQAERR